MTVDFADLVAGVLEVDPADVTDPAGQESLPTWTSLRHLQLVVTIEEAYGLSFTYKEIRDVRTIGQLRDVLRCRGVGV
jgi:acyl carrier protein